MVFLPRRVQGSADEPAGSLHRGAAVVLIAVSVYHTLVSGYRLFVLRYRPIILPTLQDMRNGIQGFLYNLRLAKTQPQQGRYTFEEKVEYWAVVWGTVVMVITGFVLWNPIAATRVLPGQFIPAAKEVHGGEALLAVLAIIVWHLYHVHIRRFNKSMITGIITEEEMLEEHPLELADLKAGMQLPAPIPQVIERRRRVYLPVAGVLAALLLAGVIYFATFEETAIATVPNPEDVLVYAPLTPTPFPTQLPTPTPEPQPAGGTAPGTWEGGIGSMFQAKCGACHGASTQLGNLNLESYTSALTGGSTGPGIVPGDPDASQIIVKQAAGGHPGQLSPEELELVRLWIAAGAPEN